MIATAPGTVDVWRADLTLPDSELARLSASLNAEETRRAARFHFERDRRRFLAARGLLRHILARYADTEPERVGLGYGHQGKPFLLDRPDTQFNLSHTGDILVVGVARGLRLGIDVERTMAESVMDEVMKTVSSEPERARLGSLTGSERLERFSQLWTRKEAYIKADGRGMSLDLKRIDVLSVPNQVLVDQAHPGGWTSCPQWTVHDLDMGSGLAAALVAEGSAWGTAHFEWPGRSR